MREDRGQPLTWVVRPTQRRIYLNNDAPDRLGARQPYARCESVPGPRPRQRLSGTIQLSLERRVAKLGVRV